MAAISKSFTTTNRCGSASVTVAFPTANSSSSACVIVSTPVVTWAISTDEWGCAKSGPYRHTLRPGRGGAVVHRGHGLQGGAELYVAAGADLVGIRSVVAVDGSAGDSPGPAEGRLAPWLAYRRLGRVDESGGLLPGAVWCL